MSIDEIDHYAAAGHDRDIARAIWSQADHRANPIGTGAVEHLLQIGYRYGRDTMLQEVRDAFAADQPVTAAQIRPRGWRRRLGFGRSSHAQTGA